jgi:hypothetical protein
MDNESPPGNGKGAYHSAHFQTQTNESRTLTVWKLNCKLELQLKRSLDALHAAEGSEVAALEETLNECATNILEVIREIRGKLRR